MPFAGAFLTWCKVALQRVRGLFSSRIAISRSGKFHQLIVDMKNCLLDESAAKLREHDEMRRPDEVKRTLTDQFPTILFAIHISTHVCPLSATLLFPLEYQQCQLFWLLSVLHRWAPQPTASSSHLLLCWCHRIDDEVVTSRLVLSIIALSLSTASSCILSLALSSHHGMES